MRTIFNSSGLRLAEVDLSTLFPRITHWHAKLEHDIVVKEIGKLGFGFVSEAEIRAYAKSTAGEVREWPEPGAGRRFLMEPIVRKHEKTGEVVTYMGPYPECGEHGYELGLWRYVESDKTKEEKFPITTYHPVTLCHSILSTLVAKML